MQHQIQGQEVTSHGKLSVGLTPDISRPAYLQENHNLTDNLPDGEDFGDVSGHLLSLLLPADRVPLISIEQLNTTSRLLLHHLSRQQRGRR